jgi:single-strand DNA-binding protein
MSGNRAVPHNTSDGRERRLHQSSGLPHTSKASVAARVDFFRNLRHVMRRVIFAARRVSSMSVNKAILVGRLGRDPETRYTSSGQAVCNFTLATDETYKDRSGERQKRTEWHRIVVWAKQAEIAQQYLHKGSLIYVEGRIQTRQWDDKEGQKRTTVEIVATNFRMLGGRSEGVAAGAGAGGSRGEAVSGVGVDSDVQAPSPDEAPSQEVSDEDIPF